VLAGGSVLIPGSGPGCLWLLGDLHQALGRESLCDVVSGQSRATLVYLCICLLFNRGWNSLAVIGTRFSFSFYNLFHFNFPQNLFIRNLKFKYCFLIINGNIIPIFKYSWGFHGESTFCYIKVFPRAHLINQYAMKRYGGVEVQLHHSWPRR
jgi:hypothetical protein